MALPRPTSIFETLGNRNLGFTIAPTGMQSGNGPDDVSMSTDACDITECSDAEFDDWLGKQKPNLGATDPAFEHKRFNNEMMQAWMTLSTAATKATAVATSELLNLLKTSRPSASDYGPQYRSLPAYDDPWAEGISPVMLEQLQQAHDAEQARIEAMKQKPLTLATRAERVQSLISIA